MFRKYMDIVSDKEGVWFLDESDWTPQEWAEIKPWIDEERAEAQKRREEMEEYRKKAVAEGRAKTCDFFDLRTIDDAP